MKTTINLILFLALAWNTANAQVGVGTNDPDASAALDVESTTKGFLPPRMDNAERNAISSPATGLTIYNTEVNCLQWYNGTAWYDRCEGGLTPGALSDCSTPGFIPPFLPADETIIKDVTSPNTGQTWMDRNLGAYNKARSSTDCWSYGNLYQWGRNSDGHEDRTSNDTVGPVAAGSEGSDFITIPVADSIFDWLSPQDDNRWNANETAGGAVVKTANDPCPNGYRVPTEAEWQAEIDNGSNASWTDATDAFDSDLALPLAGYRAVQTGGFLNVGSFGIYWSSNVSGALARNLGFSANAVVIYDNDRGNGEPVRCIKD